MKLMIFLNPVFLGIIMKNACRTQQPFTELKLGFCNQIVHITILGTSIFVHSSIDQHQ